MDTIKAIEVVRGLKEYYDKYSEAFGIVIAQLEGTLQTQLNELEIVKKERDDLIAEKNITLETLPPTEIIETIEPTI